MADTRTLTGFGASVKRKEDPALLRGEGRYVDDIHLPGMLHAAFVRSPHAHARVGRIDKTAALAVAGVHAVIAYADLPESVRRQTLPLLVPHPALRHPRMPHALAKDEACYAGEPVACVVADSRYIAEDAAQLVDVEYEPLPAANDCAAALAQDAPRAHAGADTNVAARFPVKAGDADRAFGGAAHVFREKIHQHRGGPFFMECRGAVAQYEAPTQSYTLFVSSQGPHRLKRCMLDMFELGDHQARVITPDVGGGFGPKGSYYPEYVNVAVASWLTGRPVKWIEDRRENFLATHQERDQYWDLEIAVDARGKILGVRGQLIHETGAYVPWGIVLPWITATTVPGPYVIPHFKLDVVSVYTNKIQTTPVRGAGRPEAVTAMERLMDRVARELNIDRAEVRRRNFIQPDEMPYNVGIIFRDGRPVTYDSGDYPACQAGALQAAGYDEFPQRQAVARKSGRYLGIGLANAVEATGLGPYEGATVRVSTSGKIVVYTGATPQGQSHKTTLAQIAADQLGVDFDDVTVVTADTAAISLGMGSFAARTAVNAGSSVHLAALAVAAKAKELAAGMMECMGDDLELAGGYVRLKSAPDVRKSLREIAVKAIGMPGFSMAGGLAPGLEHTAYFTPEQSVYSSGAHVAEVEVEIETGAVRILRYTVAHDCGRVINPMVVDGQIVGGVAHGVGNALFERMVYDDNAQPLSTNLGEYLLPLATDVPHVDLVHLETPSPLNPLGIKGAGEGGTIPAIAAIISAVENALAPFGVIIAEAPITPQRIVELLGEHALGRTR
ncbi:MAG TPA: xanthine dehydrogenase family protein molybdopterin-binding subunit [Burkholderiales bacterium]|nr:xanthine dehydrogenase family protein molybdopterin-binding subunit [Burkholderiales bacterium]